MLDARRDAASINPAHILEIAELIRTSDAVGMEVLLAQLGPQDPELSDLLEALIWATADLRLLMHES